MLHPIGTCLWFDQQSKEAFEFYKEVFGDVTLISENPLAVVYTLYGRRIMHLNGGPGYPINPSISFFVSMDSDAAIEQAWKKLTDGGTVLMPLNTYPWSEKYGWCADRYGVNWQLMLGHESVSKIMPYFMFVNNNNGKAGEAIAFYTSIFPESSTVSISRYEAGEPDIEGHIKYAQFLLNGLPFGAIDSSMAHEFQFSEAVSFIITVDTQEEIDYYWEKLISNNGSPGKCGWLKDPYGVHWQVVPSILGKLMSNPVTAPKAAYAFLQMSKFNIEALVNATQ